MKRTLKKLIGLMLVLALLIVPAANTVTAVNSVTEETENPYNKLHFYLDNEENYTIDSYSELVQATASLKTNAAATYALTNTEDTAESELHVTVEFASNFMETAKYQEFLDERETLETIDEVHEWRARLNAYSKEFHENLVAKNMKALSDMEYSDYDVIGYSPFVVLKTSPDDISTAALLDVASCAGVEHVSVAYEFDFDDSSNDDPMLWQNALTGINGTNIIDGRIYTGEGVRIGIQESGGICDPTHPNLVGKDITARDPNADKKEHATAVTAILAKIAPDAKFFVDNTYRYNDGNNTHCALDWFIAQQCDIVNCSWGDYSNTKDSSEPGKYIYAEKSYRYDIDALYDYQIDAHLITVVTSAGNYNSTQGERRYNPYNEISSPGYAYNVITVGGLVRKNDGTWKHNLSASYLADDDQVKPNISAPYTVSLNDVTLNGSAFLGGTSFSAPIVSGCIALLMEKNPTYKVFPERVSAVINATAQETSDYSNDIGEFDERVGSGMINLNKMLSNVSYVDVRNGNSTPGVEIINQNVDLIAGTQIQIALSWMVDASTSATSVDDVYLTDYDLYIYDSLDNLIASSTLSNTNVELIRTTITTTGTYRIMAYQCGAKNSNNLYDEISLAYVY